MNSLTAYLYNNRSSERPEEQLFLKRLNPSLETVPIRKGLIIGTKLKTEFLAARTLQIRQVSNILSISKLRSLLPRRATQIRQRAAVEHAVSEAKAVDKAAAERNPRRFTQPE
jgi:hypothetical protein